MQDDTPTISIIMPAYNAAATIAEAIRSVQVQDFPDWELIVVDDCSNDGTGAIVENLAADDPRIRLIRRAVCGGGPAQPRNKGIAASRGRYLAFLDADHLFMPQRLSAQLDFMMRMQCALSYVGYRRFKTGEKPKRVLKGPALVRFETLLRRVPVQPLTVMIDTQLTGAIQFPEFLRARDDLGLWLNLTREGHVIHFLNEDLARERINKSGNSRFWVTLSTLWTIYRHAGLTIGQRLISLICYAWFAVTKRIF